MGGGIAGGIRSWAEKRGLVEGHNPAHGVETVRGEPSDRVLFAHAPLYPAAVAALRLIALTGLRREKAVGLRWSAIDALGSCLRLETSKTGKSVRPVSGLVLDLLRDVPCGASDFVFPCRDGAAPADLKPTIGKLYDAALIAAADAVAQRLARALYGLAEAVPVVPLPVQQRGKR